MIFDVEKDQYADIMTIHEFDACVKCGAFIPDDGNGYYGTETHYSYSAGVWSEWPTKEATHVHWYNK
jgi:hypothetical protein